MLNINEEILSAASSSELIAALKFAEQEDAEAFKLLGFVYEFMCVREAIKNEFPLNASLRIKDSHFPPTYKGFPLPFTVI